MAVPHSAVSLRVGLAGALAMLAFTVLAHAQNWSGQIATPVLLIGTAWVMIVVSVLVDKVHLNPSTGMNYSLRRPTREVLSITFTKTIATIVTYGLVGFYYFTFRFYQEPSYQYYMDSVDEWGLTLLALSPFYIYFTSKFMEQPRDALWHFGKAVSLQKQGVDFELVKDHVRIWAIKGFYLAFMMSITPNVIDTLLKADTSDLFSNPVPFVLYVLKVFFVFDVVFGAIGYFCTFRIIDTHIRSANPHIAAWLAAFVCYPPFNSLFLAGPLNYHIGTQEWMVWFEGYNVFLALWGGIIAALVFVYAWSTVAFGLRFANLSYRGVITNGPYRYVKHPAYLSKNLFWWMVAMPFLNLNDPVEGFRNCILLLAVNIIYYFRAKTEEKHLLAYPEYRAYSDWVDANGLFKAFKKKNILNLGA